LVRPGSIILLTHTQGGFVRYILRVHKDETYVKTPNFSQLDALLEVRAQMGGSRYVDPDQTGD
ncbi:MAG TPA: hypothetical protein VJY15_01480, partial [Candidatus Acidoferrum sp.]|nr:hypothetical protein [Candidatus Acidoferrum sp.]